MGVRARYSRAHGDQVLGVSFVDATVFASCSQDGLVALWDIREKGPSGVIHENRDAFPTSVGCSCDNYLLVGDVAGEVHLLDVRKGGKGTVASAESALSGHRIHRIEVEQHKRSRFAVCGDSTAVRAFDVEDNSRFVKRYLSMVQRPSFSKSCPCMLFTPCMRSYVQQITFEIW